MSFMLLASIDGLRTQVGWADTWWVAAVLAVGFVAVAYWMERVTAGTPRARKGRLGITAFVVLALLHVGFALGLRLADVWTPADRPGQFHRVVAGANYGAIDVHRSETGGLPRSLEHLEQFGRSIMVAPGVEVPYFHDAWGRPLRYHDRFDFLISAGPDGRFDTADDIAIARPIRSSTPSAAHPES